MNCKHCGKPIVLSPSAEERARKFGGSSRDYIKLFDTHADCLIAKRSQESVDLMRQQVKEQREAQFVYRDGKRVVLTN